MKSVHHGTAGANRKLRGKRSVILPCRCCDMVNFTQQVRRNEALKEITTYVTDRH